MPSIAPTLCTVYAEPSSTPGIFGESIVEPIRSLSHLLGRGLSVVRSGGSLGTVNISGDYFFSKKQTPPQRNGKNVLR